LGVVHACQPGVPLYQVTSHLDLLKPALISQRLRPIMTSDSENVYTDKSSHEDVSHQIISSYFLGPQAENLQFFKDNIATILEEQQDARLNYFPQDGVPSFPFDTAI